MNKKTKPRQMGTPRSMGRRAASAKSGTDWARLSQAEAKAMPTIEHPEADLAHMVRGVVRRGLKGLNDKA